METNRFRNLIILGLFFASGATALVYEIVWSRYLTLTVGGGVLGRMVVLTVFLVGLACGSRIFGGISNRSGHPLRVFGVLATLMGLYAFLFTFLHAQVHAWFGHWGAEAGEHAVALWATKGGCGALLLLIPSMLIGGTLPLLASWLQHETVDAGRCTARYYSVTCLGALLGAAVAAYYLIPQFGLARTLQGAGLVNGVVGILALVLGRDEALHIMSPEPAGHAKASPLGRIGAAAMVGITGMITAGLAVVAIRSLSLLCGGSPQIFDGLLISLIFGLGLGGAMAASPRLKMQVRWRLATVALLVSAVWVGLLVAKMEAWVEVYRWAATGLARSGTGYQFHQGLTAVLSFLVLGVPVSLIGLVLPLYIRIGEGPGSSLGDRVGRLLTWNILGATAGLMVTLFGLMPWMGLRQTFLVWAAGLAVAAVWIGIRRGEKWVAGFSVAATAGLVALIGMGDGSWRHAFSAGVFQWHETETARTALALRSERTRLLFYEDGMVATVNVEREGDQGTPEVVRLRVNGTPEASTGEDRSAQLLAGHLPLLARPECRDVFMLGMGSGIAGGAVLRHAVETLTLSEPNASVIRAASHFAEWNNDVLTDARVRRTMEDARTAWRLSSQTYDIIISQASDPWVREAGRCFSVEFFELAATRLKPGGLFAQRIRVREMNDAMVSLVMRTFGGVFPHVEIWDVGVGDILLLGSQERWISNAESYGRGVEWEHARADLAALGVGSPEALWARQMAGQRTAFAIPEPGRTQSDTFPILEYEAPRAAYLGGGPRGLVRYDERTWQRNVSLPEKRRALSHLADLELEPLFQAHGSVNPELMLVLEGRAGGRVPCVFNGQGGVLPDALAKDPSLLAKRLAEALVLLGQADGPLEAAIDTVETALRERSHETAWPAAYCASRAAVACLELGELDRAEVLLELGLKVEPDNAMLPYLARILQRERSAPVKVSSR